MAERDKYGWLWTGQCSKNAFFSMAGCSSLWLAVVSALKMLFSLWLAVRLYGWLWSVL